jgi:hypothetical protein
MDKSKCKFEKYMFAYFSCQPLNIMNAHMADISTQKQKLLLLKVSHCEAAVLL